MGNPRSLPRTTSFALVAALSTFALASCSSPRIDSNDAPDASAGAKLDRDDSAHDVAAGVNLALAPLPSIADRFAPNHDGFLSTKDGVTSPGFRSAWVERARTVGAKLPATGNAPIEAGIGVSELYRVSLEPLKAAPAPIALDEGRAVYRDVFPATDVTFATSAERVEWAYTLRDESAPSEFQFRVKLPKHVASARLDAQGGLEFLDAEGGALLHMPRPIAVDAAGEKRDATLVWDDKTLTVRFDKAGLKYPIVLDPALETVVWQPRLLPPTARDMHVMAYDSVRKRTVLFGGYDGTSTAYGDTWEWDGVVWSLRATSGPSARVRPSMTFDTSRSVMVLFGGQSLSTGYLNDTWEWDGATAAWTKKCTTAPCSSTLPTARAGHGLVFHPPSGKSVMYGGWIGTGVTVADTWTWDGSAWTNTGASGPSARQAFGMTYDGTGSRVLLFGGQSGNINGGANTYYNDLYAWNGSSWSTVTTSGGPPGVRSQLAFTFQSSTGKVLLFGGWNSGGSVGDTWQLTSSTNTWTASASPNPSARYLSAFSYDASRQKVVMFGGYGAGAYGDTQEWDSAAQTWSFATGQIPGRTSAAAIYDSYRNRTVVFGGQSLGTWANDMWEYTGLAWTRVCTSAPCSTSLPAGRSGTAFAYDATRRRFVLFGGQVGGVESSETWEFDGDVWAQKCTSCTAGTTKPPSRFIAAAAFDAKRNKVVVFGGRSGSTSLNDTWEWDGTSWVHACTLTPCSSTIPSVRYGHAMAFDAGRNKIVLFGGGDASPLGDTWEYDGTQWTLASSTGPSARRDARLVYDDTRKKVILFGGSILTGGVTSWVGDTWEWDGSTWTNSAASGAGPSDRSRQAMVYDSARRRTVLFSGASVAASGDTWEYYSRGGACTLGSECSTGYCVDGVCCEQISCSTCQACNQTGAIGTCSSVTNAPDPDSCPAGTSSCDGAGICKLKQAQPCSSNGQCASGFCADGYCCNAACSGGCDVCNVTPGTCTVLAKGAAGSGCGAYFCDGASGSCPTTCAVDTDCGSGFFCAAGGICQARRAQGGSCNVASGGDCMVTGCRECSGSLTCKDGYCCNGGCTGSCQTCAATPGTCTTVTNADDLDTCTGTSTCSASGTCLARPGSSCTSSAQCASGNCIDGYCCNTACGGGCDVCNATPGTCTVVAQGNAGVSCGAYVCNGSSPACPTTCGNDADCASGYYCSSAGTCVAQKAKGLACNQTAGADCKSTGCRVCATGNCIDGYCCDTACGGSCDACNGATLGWSGATNGTCALAPVSYAGSPACVTYACNGTSATCATSCTSDAQCASGFYCNSSGACVAQKAQGSTCNLTTDCKSGSCRECASGNCVDGYCCNSACNGQCQACDAPGTPGLCVTVNGPVHVNPLISSRVACAGTGACGASCNGTDANACHYAGASVACGTTSCTAGIQTNVGTCNGTGACNQTTTPCLTYACGTTTCKTSCTVDADCATSSNYCSGGACVAKKATGEICTAANACLSGNCVDGVCCSSASCSAGLRCNLPGTLGTCAKPNGVACTVSTECGSGFCVDGVCCDTKCGSQCAACDVTGKVGTCSAVAGPPRGGRPACSGVGAGTECGQVCDGTDITACHYPTASKSCGANSCTNTGGTYVEKHTSTCDGSGACSDVPKTCGGFVCDTSACKTTCTTNADCTTGNYCKSGACIPIEGLGTPCTSAATCTSGFCTDGVCCAVAACGAGKSCSAGTGGDKGFCRSLNGTDCSANAECVSKACVDGVCCDSACNGACEACNKVGSVGKCVPIVGTPQVGHPACTGTSTDADCAQRCDGTDGSTCKYPGTSASCGKPSCGGGVETEVSTCDGAGTCKSATKTCAPYVCGPTACLSSCTTNADCGKGNYCKTGSCVKVEGLGKACAGDAECDSGFCTDGVCCSAASCGEGSSCSSADSLTPGACLKKKGVTCTKGDECATGRCVDGVCCDLACDGQCEACDVKGSEGTCTPVVGPPHGVRVACDSKDANDCSKAQCNGKARDKCEGWVNGGTTSCGTPSCTGDKRYQAIGACDGVGKCAMPEPKPCTPYACDATASTGCKTACTADTDCADEFKCEEGKCVQGATCSSDGLSSVSKTGETVQCTPYRCGTDGKCRTACATSDDCAPGTSCDPSVKACVVFTPDEGGDGGCGCRTPSSGNTGKGGLAALALIALAVARRRRLGA